MGSKRRSVISARKHAIHAGCEQVSNFLAARTIKLQSANMISTVLRSEMNISRRRRLNQNVNPRCRVNRERERERGWKEKGETEKRNEKKTRPGCVVDVARRRWRSTTNTRAACSTGQRALGNVQSTFTRTNEMRFRGLSKFVDQSKLEIYARTIRDGWK